MEVKSLLFQIYTLELMEFCLIGGSPVDPRYTNTYLKQVLNKMKPPVIPDWWTSELQYPRTEPTTVLTKSGLLFYVRSKKRREIFSTKDIVGRRNERNDDEKINRIL